jgi:hemerythrin
MSEFKLIHITEGTYWLEVPAADLRILCGCPADAVKFMMRRGLIVETHVDDVLCESGPNAILLSDVPLQKGQFSNLAEFPVLQMLYRQGILLPKHPNNNGVRPLLMGSLEQVSAQLEYIRRGNYGLVSEAELREAGLKEELISEWYNLKLRFSFGKILESQELLQPFVIESEFRELRNGVLLRRISQNIFEFKFNNEVVTINLNLREDQNYGSPYPLGFHNVPRGYFSILHSGEGDGWDINRPCMSSILMFQGKIYLLDAGPNLLASLNSLGIGISEVEGIFHTHCHDDHFAGLVTLVRSDHKIKYYSTSLVRHSVMKKLSALIGLDEHIFFDLFDVRDLDFNRFNDIDGLEVMPLLSPHPVETCIFVFRSIWEGGYRSYAHFADIVSLDLLSKMRTTGTKQGISDQFFQMVKTQYLTPVDIKKIDIGGGLIHGQAGDFLTDESNKIILSHTALPLSNTQKEIGSGAPFGTVDTLIPTSIQYEINYAQSFLQEYFPGVSKPDLERLLNSPVVNFNPESFLLRRDRKADAVYLLLTGTAEQICPGHDSSQFSSGSLIGDLSVLNDRVSPDTVRALSFVKAMRISADLYLDFVQKNNLRQEIERLCLYRGFLLENSLFGPSISYPIQNELARKIQEKTYKAGEVILETDREHLFLVASGCLQRVNAGYSDDIICSGGFFGEELILFGTPGLFHLQALEDTVVFNFAAGRLKEIPLITLRLLETFGKRSLAIFEGNEGDFQWKPDYAVQIGRFDHAHRALFNMASTLHQAGRANVFGSDLICRALDFLADYVNTHFFEEEEIMEKYGFSGLSNHKKHHKSFIKRIEKIQGTCQLGANCEIGLDELISFFRDFGQHIILVDSLYAPFLRGKGVF